MSQSDMLNGNVLSVMEPHCHFVALEPWGGLTVWTTAPYADKARHFAGRIRY